MTPRKNIVSVSVDADSAQIVKTIETEGFSRIPVTGEDGKEIVGILHARDYFLKKDTAGFELRDILRQPVFVPESVHLDVLFRDMQKDHNHMVIVADEYGSTAGIVTMEDIIEEIVGEIWDERDREIDEFSMIAPGLYRVLCSCLLYTSVFRNKRAYKLFIVGNQNFVHTVPSFSDFMKSAGAKAHFLP